MTDEITTVRMGSCRSLSGSVVSNSVHTFVNYNKKMQFRLAEINNSVSSVIKESCMGIDNICNKVRKCLFEMDNRERTMYVTDDLTEYELLEERSERKSVSETEYKSAENVTRSVEELTQDNDETLENTSVIEIMQDDSFDKRETSNSILSLTPFFSVIDREGDQNPSIAEYYRRQLFNKAIYNLMNKDGSETKLQLTESDSEMALRDFKDTINALCDNFEIMGEIIENINKDISKLSTTALMMTSRSEISDEGESQKEVRPLRSIKRLSKNKSRQKCIQVGDCLSDSNLDFMQLMDKDSSSFIIPDVYRKRAFTDLHDRLVTQIEANDSLIFFQTLMNRQKTLEKDENCEKKGFSQMKLNIPVIKKISATTVPNQTTKKTDIGKKYADSLWFSQKPTIKNGSRGSCRKEKRGKCRRRTTRTIENRSLTGDSNCSATDKKNRNRKTTVTESNRSLVWDKPSPKLENNMELTRKQCSLDCTCGLVVQNDMSQSASSKCHLQWLKTKNAQAPQRKLVFLDILDDLTQRDLMPLRSEYPRKDNQQARELDYKDVQDTYLYKLMYGKQGTKSAWKQLLEPTVTCSKNCDVCKTNRSPRSKKVKEEKAPPKYTEKYITQNYSKTDVLKRLTPYIMYDPDKTEERYNMRSVIVMPVRVYYDNYKTNEPPTKLKNTNKSNLGSPRKMTIAPPTEIKWTKRPELPTPKISRPFKVVFDGSPKKLELPPINSPLVKPSPMSNRPLFTSARLSTDKLPTKKAASRSFSPKSFSPYCSEPKSGRKEPMNSKHLENVAVYNKIQADIDKIKNEIYGKKTETSERKIWMNKYGKSTGQQLVSFVQNQTPEEFPPKPKYAIPNLNLKKLVTARKQTHVKCVRETASQKQVLRHVQGLRMKNDAIQSNIKKAIEVIESKMVDILCDDSNSVEAFEVMEKEITNVLSLMKCKGRTDLQSIPSRSSESRESISGEPVTEKTLEENYDIISEQLFERLERILDTDSSVSNVVTAESCEFGPRRKRAKDETRKKPKHAASRKININFISPSSSASMEETRTLKRISRHGSKKREKAEAKSILSRPSTPLKDPIIAEDSCGDQNTVNLPRSEEIIKLDDRKIHLKTRKVKTLQNFGDFKKKDELTVNDQIQNEVPRDDEAETLHEESPEVLLNVTDLTNDKEETTPVACSETEKFINEELNKIIDSIVSFGEKTSIENVQIEKATSTKHLDEKVESSDYIGPQSETIESDNKLETLYLEDKMEQTCEPAKVDETVQITIEIGSEDSKEEPILPEEDCGKSEHLDEETQVENSLNDLEKGIETPELHNESQILKENDSFTYSDLHESMDLDQEQEKDASNLIYTNNVHKIIKRVEDIYSQLDDIQNTNSMCDIPVFREVNLSEVRSEIFLTPFMQAVKETQQNTEKNEKEALLEKSPSYYNIMSFLDALSNIQKETPFEVHTAYECDHAYAYSQAVILEPAETWHESYYFLYRGLKSCCTKKQFEETDQGKLKRVSFLGLQEDKESQISLCPYHSKIRIVRISSQQFPPLDSDDETYGNTSTSKEDSTEPRQPFGTEEFESPPTDDLGEKILCQVHGLIEKTRELQRLDVNNEPLCVGGWDMSDRNHDVEIIGDKSTQVFCQMHEQENKVETSLARNISENVCLTSNDEQSVDYPECVEENPDDSKSTEKDFLEDSLLDPFYDYNAENVTAKRAMEKIEEVMEENHLNTVGIAQAPPKVVVFREVLDAPSVLGDLDGIEQYKKRLEKRRRMRLVRKSSLEKMKQDRIARDGNDTENEVFLKSFYAIVYILMFTALSLDYTCV